MRQDIIDEVTGERVPFRDFTNYNQLMHLVPNADCDTRAGVITVWRDSRPQPTYDEIATVSDEDAELAAIPFSEALMADADEVLQAILDASPGLRAKVLKQLQLTRGK